MLDDKIKLEQYFEEEIKRVSDIEIAGIEQEIDEIRKKSNKTQHLDIDNIKNINIEDKSYQPLDKCLASELGCIIKNCILSLPINSRIAIVLREFEGMSYNDIANLTNTNIGTVKSRISRARLKLQEELQEYI